MYQSYYITFSVNYLSAGLIVCNIYIRVEIITSNNYILAEFVNIVKAYNNIKFIKN